VLRVFVGGWRGRRGGGEGVGPAVGKLWECSKSRPTWSEPLRQPWLRTHSAFRPRSFFGKKRKRQEKLILFCFFGVPGFITLVSCLLA
jgi:hypothetical protein